MPMTFSDFEYISRNSILQPTVFIRLRPGSLCIKSCHYLFLPLKTASNPQKTSWNKNHRHSVRHTSKTVHHVNLPEFRDSELHSTQTLQRWSRSPLRIRWYLPILQISTQNSTRFVDINRTFKKGQNYWTFWWNLDGLEDFLCHNTGSLFPF